MVYCIYQAKQCHNNMLIYPTINQKKLIDANLRNNLRAYNN